MKCSQEAYIPIRGPHHFQTEHSPSMLIDLVVMCSSRLVVAAIVYLISGESGPIVDYKVYHLQFFESSPCHRPWIRPSSQKQLHRLSHLREGLCCSRAAARGLASFRGDFDDRKGVGELKIFGLRGLDRRWYGVYTNIASLLVTPRAISGIKKGRRIKK